jgi:1,4-alpha-glucan branching enzyme
MKTKRVKKSPPASTPGRAATVVLRCHAPDAKSVYVAGAFNDWRPDVTPLQPQANGLWTIELDLPPGDYEYRFVVDGCWCSDPEAKETVPNPFGDYNAVLRVPRAA